MKVKDSLSRAFGGAAGVALGIAVPHIGCLGAFTATAIGVGFNAAAAQTVAAVAGGVALLGAAGAAVYGIRPSKELCCLVWGETPRVRAAKMFAMAVAGFAVSGVINTATNRGVDNSEVMASYLEMAHRSGQSVWQALDNICTSRPR